MKATSKRLSKLRPRRNTQHAQANGHPQTPITATTGIDETVMNNSLYLETFETKSIQGHAGNVLNGMEIMWHQNDLCDVTIVAEEGRRFHAHRTVLASCADFFHTTFSNVPEEQNHGRRYEVCLDFASPATMTSILECMYTGKVNISESNVRELLVAAAYLKFYAVEQACGDFLQSRLNQSNCLRMLNLAVTYDLLDLSEESLHLASVNFMQVTEGFDFLHLEIEQVIMLLERDDIKVILIIMIIIK